MPRLDDDLGNVDGEPWVWRKCRERLEEELPSEQFNAYIRPLQVAVDQSKICVRAPNIYVQRQVEKEFLWRILELISEFDDGEAPDLELDVGTGRDRNPGAPLRADAEPNRTKRRRKPNLDSTSVFSTFVEGKSNELAKAAAQQVAANPGKSYNPLLLYGGVGLGKTHLMHAVGNGILARRPGASVVCVRSEQFVNDMVRGIRTGSIQQTMEYYRSVDVLLIDDIQFFAGKVKSQDDFFHVFNSVRQRNHQIVLTCDKYPREIRGLEERLKSRFVGGLTIELELPELETRVAILQKKGEAEGVSVPDDVAFHIAEHIRSNIRELEGALQRVIAHARFMNSEVTIDLVKRALYDQFASQGRQMTIENIQKVVAEYYNMKHSDLLSHRRNRAIARPRQMAMCLAKEFTKRSYPEIGEQFGGRDHTTVLYACRRIAELRKSIADVDEDHRNLSRLLTQ